MSLHLKRRENIVEGYTTSLKSLQGEWTTNVSTLHYYFRLCGVRSDFSM